MGRDEAQDCGAVRGGDGYRTAARGRPSIERQFEPELTDVESQALVDVADVYDNGAQTEVRVVPFEANGLWRGAHGRDYSGTMRMFVTATLALTMAWGQSDPAALAARKWREAHERAIVAEFLQLLAMPNLARDEANIRRNAAAVAALMEKRGVKTRLLEMSGVPPLVFGEIRVPGATRTIVFY